MVVESFYYVFQMSGGAKSITREEIRAFKKVWAEYANPKTGYLERGNFVKFFGVSSVDDLLFESSLKGVVPQRLSGIFEVRIYPAQFSIPNLAKRSKAPPKDEHHGQVVDGVDLDTLNANLDNIDRATIKRRKELYNRLYHEARISYEPGKGISFTNMLLLLAHHKLIEDREALV